MKINRAHKEGVEARLVRIKKLLDLAYNESPFYRRIYEGCDFHPSQVETLDDFGLVPVINRQMIQDAQLDDPFALVPKSKRSGISWHQTTSGSSGTPITIYASRVERLRILGVILRAYRINGLRYSDTSVTIKDPVDIAKPNILQRLGGFRHEYYSIYQPIEEIRKSIADKWESVAILKSMPSDLANLGWLIKSEGLDFPPVRCLFTDSEKLDDATREFIEDVFNAQAIDFYATTEVGVVAFQSKESEGKYHVNDDAVLVETKSSIQLEQGDEDLILTGLINFTTPIIRYQIGDIVTPGDRIPTNNLAFSTLERIHGKYLDFIVGVDGSIVSSHAVKQNLTHLNGIRRFQVIQKELSSLQIYIAPDSQWTTAVLEEIIRLFKRDFGPEMKIEVVLDENLVFKAKDYKKFKVVESLVAQQLLSG